MNFSKAEDKIGKKVMRSILDEVETDSINAQKMKDIAKSLHQSIGGAHSKRMNKTGTLSDDAEMRNIFSDWWEMELFNVAMTRQEAITKLVEIFESSDVNLRPLAATLRSQVLEEEDGTTSTANTMREDEPEASADQMDVEETNSNNFSEGDNSEKHDTVSELQKAQKTMFGIELQIEAPVQSLIQECLKKMDDNLRLPLDTANTHLGEAFSSMKIGAASDAKDHFLQSRNDSIKAFCQSQGAHSLKGLCHSSRMWILSDFGLLSYDEEKGQFISLGLLDNNKRESCLKKVKERTEKVLDAIHAAEGHGVQEKQKVCGEILSQVWPFLEQFSPDHNIPRFPPR